jgi:hypothetical protein
MRVVVKSEIETRLRDTNLLTFDANGALKVTWADLREYITNFVTSTSLASISVILYFVNDELARRIANEVATQPGDSTIDVQRQVENLLDRHEATYGTSQTPHFSYANFLGFGQSWNTI